MKEINISSKSRNYNVIIQNNLLDKLDVFIDPKKFYVLIYDDLIPEKYVTKVFNTFENILKISFPSGEKSKSSSEFNNIIKFMQENNVKRDACIIALGGGVTGDLAGFIASVYFRGIDLIQIPTTLLAQIDSSVGGKVAINTDLSKNSIGNFYPPKLVLIDPLTLDTLSERQFSNGMAELIKYGMIASKPLFDKITNFQDKNSIEELIYESIKIKKDFVEKDEFDKGHRQALNFGHTYGHAYEAYYKYEKYLHGEAVALGMILATKNEAVKEELIKVLNKFNLPTKDNAKMNDLKVFIKNDKKNTQNFLNMIFVNEIGKYEISPIKI